MYLGLGYDGPDHLALLAVYHLVEYLHCPHRQIGLGDISGLLGLLRLHDDGDADLGDLRDQVHDYLVVVLQVGVGLHHECDVPEGDGGPVPLGEDTYRCVPALLLRGGAEGVAAGPGGVAVRGVEICGGEEDQGLDVLGEVGVVEAPHVDVPVEAVHLLEVVEVALPEGEAVPVRDAVDGPQGVPVVVELRGGVVEEEEEPSLLHEVVDDLELVRRIGLRGGRDDEARRRCEGVLHAVPCALVRRVYPPHGELRREEVKGPGGYLVPVAKIHHHPPLLGLQVAVGHSLRRDHGLVPELVGLGGEVEIIHGRGRVELVEIGNGELPPWEGSPAQGRDAVPGLPLGEEVDDGVGLDPGLSYDVLHGLLEGPDLIHETRADGLAPHVDGARPQPRPRDLEPVPPPLLDGPCKVLEGVADVEGEHEPGEACDLVGPRLDAPLRGAEPRGGRPNHADVPHHRGGGGDDIVGPRGDVVSPREGGHQG